MSDRLPPLTSLRAFEAAARHMSFQKAAKELFVTPAALSFQIKSLEEHLGQPVFRRLNRAVELTEAGKALYPGTSNAFQSLTSAWRAAQRTGDTRILTVTSGPAFTSTWLAPRLYSFALAHPEIELRFSAGIAAVDLNRTEIDVAIRFGYGPDPDLYEERLMNEWVTPMMSPKLAETIHTPQDLIKAPLLHQDDTRFLKPPCDWPAWFRAEQLPRHEGIEQRFSHADHAINAAIAGAGVMLARISLTSNALTEGRLVAPFPLAIQTDAHYRFLCVKGSETDPAIAAFREWLKSEISHNSKFDAGRQFIAASDIAPE